MADPKTQFLTNNALTRKRWARDLFSIILPNVEFSELTGTSSDSIVQLRTELGKGEGDEITFGIRLPLSGEGVVGNDTLEGNEEKLVFKNFKMTIDELNHAVDTGGRMEEQRIPYDLMTEGKNGLQDWWVAKLSDLLINTLAGNVNFKIAGKSFANTITAPDTGHALVMNGLTEATLTSADVMDLNFLNKMKQRAELPAAGCYKIRPLKINGKSYFRVYLHNYAFDMLRENVNIGQWGDLLRAAGKLQQPNVEIEYNGMLIAKTERLPNVAPNSVDASAGAYRAILVGAQAGCWAWGGAGESKGSVMSFTPYTRDAERFVNIRGGGIFGMKKTGFDSKDYGVIVGSSWANPL
jgi:N4-gp56 family major capsid protein